MPRKLKNLKVNFISLVKSPANEKSLVLKSDEKPTIFEIKKTDEEQMRAYGIVYAPDQTDAQGDYADAETILKAANDFMLSGRNQSVDKNHDFVESGAYVAESWIVKENDPVFQDEKPGAWAVGIQIEDDRTWASLKKGELSGLSLAGTAETIEKSDGDNAILKWLKDIFKSQNQGVEEMTKEETQTMIDEALKGQKEIMKNINDRLDALMKSNQEPEDDPDKKPKPQDELIKAMNAINDKMDELSKVVLQKGTGTVGTTGVSEDNPYEECV